MRVLVVGCGGLGGIVAGHLAREGHDVSVVTPNEAIATAIERRNLRVRTARRAFDVSVRVLRDQPEPDEEPFDTILLATQPNQVEAAMRRVEPWLSDDGRAVCFQNGLCEERVARIVGAGRVVGAVVFWGASMPEPGTAVRTSAGAMSLGRLDGTVDASLERLTGLLSCLGPVRLTPNLRGVRWSKLAVNCAMSTFGTIGGQPVGVLMQRYDARQLGIEAISEAVLVARADGVRLEKPAGWIDLGWLVQDGRRGGGSPCSWLQHAMVLASVIPYRRLRSSMLAAIERGREPAVDYLNGEVVERAGRLGMSARINREARDVVWSIARGEVRPSVETLHALYERTR